MIVSSIVGKRGVPYMGACAATKFAQVGLAECLRAEVAGSGIHVSVVFPISTDTDFFEVMARESGTITRATGPRQQPADVADAIARSLDRPAAEVYPYAPARGLVLINALAAGLVRSARPTLGPQADNVVTSCPGYTRAQRCERRSAKRQP